MEGIKLEIEVRRAENDKNLQSQYEYITIELLDQMIRTTSEGERQKYWNSKDKNEGYILQRTGYPEQAKNKKEDLRNRIVGAF